MTQRAITSKNKTTSGLIAAAVASAAFVTSALGSAPQANASCTSLFGFGNSADCSSNLFSVAIAIGTNAQAHADGLFGAAIATGINSIARTNPSGVLNIATALEDHSQVIAGGIVSLAVSVGQYGLADAGVDTAVQSVGNVAINLGNHSATGFNTANAIGIGNSAINVGGYGAEVAAYGFFSTAGNLFGNNDVFSGTSSPGGSSHPTGVGNVAFSAFGTGNFVMANPGPFAIAGALSQQGAVIIKESAGFNINGIKVGGAAAPAKAATTVKAAASGSSKNRTTSSAAAVKHSKK
jgi:hypothetical protein